MMSRTAKMGLRRLALFGVAAVMLAGVPARATIIFSRGGTNGETGNYVQGDAAFTVSGSTLTILLSNTTPTTTSTNGNVLTGVLFDVDGVNPVLTLTGVTVPTGSTLYTANSTSSATTDITGSYTDVFGVTPPGSEFGAATTGFGGAFSAGNITLGTGSADYGAVAPGTFPSAISNPNQFPLVQSRVLLTYTFTGSLAETSISNVSVLFGTSGQGTIRTPPPIPGVPEPSTIALLGMALPVGIVAYRRRNRIRLS